MKPELENLILQDQKYVVQLNGRGAGKSEYRNAVLSIESLLLEWQESTDAIIALKKIEHDLDTECDCDTCSSVAAIKLQYK